MPKTQNEYLRLKAKFVQMVGRYPEGSVDDPKSNRLCGGRFRAFLSCEKNSSRPVNSSIGSPATSLRPPPTKRFKESRKTSWKNVSCFLLRAQKDSLPMTFVMRLKTSSLTLQLRENISGYRRRSYNRLPDNSS